MLLPVCINECFYVWILLGNRAGANNQGQTLFWFLIIYEWTSKGMELIIMGIRCQQVWIVMYDYQTMFNSNTSETSLQLASECVGMFQVSDAVWCQGTNSTTLRHEQRVLQGHGHANGRVWMQEAFLFGNYLLVIWPVVVWLAEAKTDCCCVCSPPPPVSVKPFNFCMTSNGIEHYIFSYQLWP